MAFILVIDDSRLSRKIAEISLEKAGHQVLSTGDWVQGTILIHQHKPDVVLLDVHMPDIKGPQGLEMLKGDPSFSLPKIVFFSGEEEGVLARLVEEHGVHGYIQKDKQMDQMAQIIEKLLDSPK